MKVAVAAHSAYGFAAPAAEVARHLVAAGHEVRVVTGRGARSMFPPGTTVPAGDSDVETFAVHQWAHPVAAALQLKHLEHALADFDAELVVASELTLGVRLASARHDLPMVTIGGASWLYPVHTVGSVAPRSLDAREQELSALREYQLRESCRLLAEAAAALKLDRPSSGLPFLGDRYLLRSTPSLSPHLPVDSGFLTFAGSMMPPPGDRLDRVDRVDGVDRVLVALGRTFGAFDAWDRMVSGLREDGSAEVDVLVGRGAADQVTDSGPAGVNLLESLSADGFAAYDVVVIAATTWQTVAALRAGCAIVCCPAGAEQPIVARDLAALGRAVMVEGRRVEAADLLAARTLRDASDAAATAEELQRELAVEATVLGW